MFIGNYLQRHLQVFLGTIGRLAREPLSHLFTITVIAIAFALPTILYLVVSNLARAGSGWDGRPQVSVFLQLGINSEQAIAFGQALMSRPVIDDIQFIAPDQALQSFQKKSGFGDLMAQFDHNPIPPLLVVFPDAGIEPVALEHLVAMLRQLPEVDSASYDQVWLQRLNSMLDLVRYGVIILAAMMSLGVLLVIANTIRLSIAARKREIEIIDQVGGTHAFIRRPFLYLGVIQAVLGCALSIALVELVFFLIDKPISALSILYNSDFSLRAVDLHSGLFLLALAAILGWSAAWLSVARHLQRIAAGDPN